MIAAGGTLVSELVVAVLALLMISLHFQKYAHKIFHIELPFACLKEICRTAFPVTLNRLLLSVLAGIEVVLIPQRLSDVWAFRFGITQYLRDFYRTGASVHSFSGYDHKLCFHDAHAFCCRDAGAWISETYTVCYLADDPCKPFAWISVRVWFLLHRSVYGDSIVSQSDCRDLHTDAFFRLPVSLSEHNAYEYPAWAWSDRTKSCTQCSGDPCPDPFCSIRDSACRNPRLSIWNPFQRDSFQQPSYFMHLCIILLHYLSTRSFESFIIVN